MWRTRWVTKRYPCQSKNRKKVDTNSQNRKILVAHHWMGRGGSESTAMWTLQALQDDGFDVTLTTASQVDWDDLNSAYGTDVDPGKITFLQAPRIPTVNHPAKLVFLQLGRFQRHCKKIADSFDLCISAYNPIDFGRPGIQLIGDFSFDEEMRRELSVHGTSGFKHRDSFFRNLYLKLAQSLFDSHIALADRGDLILANSEWAARKLGEHFGISEVPVIYPPAVLPKPTEDKARNPMGFVCLGRISPEKELERIVSILRAVRAQGYDVSLQMIGHLGSTPYEEKISALVRKNKIGFTRLDFSIWRENRKSFRRTLLGCTVAASKPLALPSRRWLRWAAFRLFPTAAAQERLSGLPDLQFGSEDEAVKKIIHLLKHPEKARQIRLRLSQEMDKFGPSVFMEELRGHVDRFLSAGAETISQQRSVSYGSQTQNQTAIV